MTAVAVVIATLAMHRATAMMHELAHLPSRAVPHLSLAWNALWGVPFLLPSWLYERVHLEHHRRRVYGTKVDPEYFSFIGQGRLRVALSGVLGLFLPVMLLLRFMVLSPFAWLSPSLRRHIDARASALTPNPAWQPPTPSTELRRRMVTTEVLCFAWAWSLVALTAMHLVSARVLIVPCVVMFGAVACNQFRAHAAHRFTSDGRQLDDAEILRDSLNVEVSGLGRLLFPLGTQFHALHHFAPAIPFHHLPEAHARLTRLLPRDSSYHAASARSAFEALAALFESARSERAS